MTSLDATVRPTYPAHVDLTVPRSWPRRAAPERGVLVAARAPTQPASGVRPELVLRTCRVDDDLAAWRRRARDDLARLLDDYADDGVEQLDLAGRPAVHHRFSHRVGVADVLCEQWSWLVDGIGLTLTCSAARVDHPDHEDLFEEVAASVVLRSGPAG